MIHVFSPFTVLERRGIPPETINLFCAKVGVTMFCLTQRWKIYHGTATFYCISIHHKNEATSIFVNSFKKLATQSEETFECCFWASVHEFYISFLEKDIFSNQIQLKAVLRLLQFLA